METTSICWIPGKTQTAEICENIGLDKIGPWSTLWISTDPQPLSGFVVETVLTYSEPISGPYPYLTKEGVFKGSYYFKGGLLLLLCFSASLLFCFCLFAFSAAFSSFAPFTPHPTPQTVSVLLSLFFFVTSSFFSK